MPYVILTDPSVQVGLVIDRPHVMSGFVLPAVDDTQAQLEQFLQLQTQNLSPQPGLLIDSVVLNLTISLAVILTPFPQGHPLFSLHVVTHFSFYYSPFLRSVLPISDEKT